MKNKINLHLLPIKAHYFFFNGGTAPLMPFVPVLAKQLGVDQVGVGIMYMILPFVGLIAKPLFGFISDKFRIGKLIFMLTIALTGVFFSAICFIPGKPTEALLNLDCSSNATLLKTCDDVDSCTLDKLLLSSTNNIMKCSLNCTADEQFLKDMCDEYQVSEACDTKRTWIEFTTNSNLSKTIVGPDASNKSCLFFDVDLFTFGQEEVEHPHFSSSTSMQCSVVCDNLDVQSYIQKPIPDAPGTTVYSTLQFQLLLGLMIGSWASMAVVVSLSDSICFSLLENKPHNYGAQRLWGALGWGFFGIISGYLIDVASAGKPMKDYTPSLYLIIILLVINLLFVSKMRVEHHETPMVFKRVLCLFKDPRVVLFLFSCVAFGICMGTVWQFLFWYLEEIAMGLGCSSLKWIKLLEGLAMGIQCFAGEAPFLFLSGGILKKLGHVHTMTMIMIAMAIRLMCYSLLTNPWYVLPIELLNGLTLGVYWSAMASYAYIVAPPGTASTVQGIFSAIFEGIGTSIGSLLGGVIFQTYGGVVLFRSMGLFALITGVLFSLSNLFLDKVFPKDDSVAEVAEYSSEEESFNRIASGPKGDVD